MRVIIWDTTAGWLSRVWAVGAWLFTILGRADALVPVASWEDLVRALDAFGTDLGNGNIKSVEYWGHGAVGYVFCNREALDPMRLMPLRRYLHANATWWWRTCSAFSGRPGYEFASRCARILGVTVAGHTYIIWFWQSGLRTLAFNAKPNWPLDEGRTPQGKSLWSWPRRPSTVTIFGRLRKGSVQ